jgi:hypothetical protein
MFAHSGFGGDGGFGTPTENGTARRSCASRSSLFMDAVTDFLPGAVLCSAALPSIIIANNLG